MEQNTVPFLEMFAVTPQDAALAALLEQAQVVNATVDKAHRTMQIRIRFPRPAAPVYISMIEQLLKTEYAVSGVEIVPVYPLPNAAGSGPETKASGGAKSGGKGKTAVSAEDVIIGRPAGKPTIHIGEITLESGNVVVEGEVFAAEHREIAKRKAVVLSFNLSDGTGSIHVSKFMTEENAKDIAARVKNGMYLIVAGGVGYNRYDGDITLEPRSITVGKKAKRMDTCEKGRRVELHLHTKMSTMDALTDTGAAVKRAIEWGHRAIAITDHGVCQSFPDAMRAAKDKIKILYGVEGYYYNDVDDKPAAWGVGSVPADSEIVAFDIETTGLDSTNDRITEIGAVIMHGGEELDRFQTFVDPQMPIPDSVSRLTGITDDDVRGAPDQTEAVRAFLAFAGGRPLAAHNASFDIGFIYEACQRGGLEFEPAYLDTLPMAQGLLPEMKNHKLDMVAAKLGLPEFEHHRASDDAVTCGLILAAFLEQMRKDGVCTLDEIAGYVQPRRLKASEQRRFRPQHIIVLARTQAGIRNLYKIVTKSHLEHFRRYPTIPKSLLSEYRDGLIVGSACEAGEVFQLVSDHRSPFEQRRLGAFYDYLEIQPICNNMFMLSGEHARAKNEEELRDFNRRVIELADELGKPVVATGDVHFLDPEDEIFRHVLLTAKEFDDADKPLPIYFRTTDEMLEEFSYLGEDKAFEVVVTNPNRIADACEDVRPLPPPTLFPPKIENSAEDLKNLVYGKMHQLYGENPPEIVTQRIETELDAILGRGYDVIYMSAQKLVADSLAHGYLVGSRGSVGSSLVAFMSGITEVNSLPAHYRCPNCCHTDFEAGKGYGCGADMPDAVCPVCGTKYAKDGFDIPFETFLGFGGDKVPDIDLNFSGEYQANAHRYTNTLFGSDHVFRAGTIGTVAEKTAYGYVKKYLEKVGRTVTKAEETRLALGCVGVKRTTGQHPGGLVVIPQDKEIYDFCPAQHPADDADTDIITTHFEYHCMEANLLKLDELGHDDPTMIRMLEDLTGCNAREIPLDDPETMGIFKSAAPLGLTDDDPIIGKTGTIGIPEFGTGFTRQMLVDTQPTDFDTLVRLSGFSHGTDVWLGNAKDLILSGTATVRQTIGCRDDIMIYLISMGLDEKRAFKFMEAVRKGAIHKGKPWPDGIVEEMQAHNVPEWYIESCRKIQYLFPKAHAVAYVMMAFRIAWFKVHEPLAFYSAYFYRRSQKDSFDAALMTGGAEKVAAKIREIKNNPDSTAKEDDLLTTLEACYEFYRRGFEFEPIDLYASDAVRFNITEKGLRPPFVAVSGLGETAARDLVEHRNDREFVSLEDLAACCTKVSKTHIEQLKALGALGSLPDTSQLSLF